MRSRSVFLVCFEFDWKLTFPLFIMASSSEEHDHYNGWNPMNEVSASFSNSSHAGGSNFYDLLSGVASASEETLCPFNDGSGGCFKKLCKLKHVPYSTKDLNARPKLLTAVTTKKETICTIDQMSPQTLPRPGCVSLGIVTSCLDPGFFHVVPEYGWRCLCDIKHDLPEPSVDSLPRSRNYFNALKEFQTSMMNYQRREKVKIYNYFSRGDLVAVNLASSECAKSYFRGVILADTEVDDDDIEIDKPVNVQVQLLDYGLSYEKKSVDMFLLPSEFSHASAMAYRCSLYGVSPIMGSWSKSANLRFKELVIGSNSNVLLEVVKTSTQMRRMYHFQEDCLLVKIYVKTSDEAYINVAKDLTSAGVCVPWKDNLSFS